MTSNVSRPVNPGTDCSALCCACTAIAFWYKPDASHKHLYPSVKDDDGNPKTVTIDGEEQYAVCKYGIEVFNTRNIRSALCPQRRAARASNASAVCNPSKRC
eukprot:6208260-Pleurochrysis_carterae.AAC.1